VGGQSSESSGRQSSTPGTLSPITATLLSLFGGAPGVSGGQFQPTSLFGPGAAFTPQSFAALQGLLAGQPVSGAESAILGVGPTTTSFNQAGFNQALAAAQAAQAAQVGAQGVGTVRRGGGTSKGTFGTGIPAAAGAPVTMPNPADFTTTQAGAFGQVPGFQELGLASALQSQSLLQQGAAALPGLLGGGTEAAVAQARRGFSQETLPGILERAPGFSSSDLQRELSRAGVDLETNIAAMREQGDLARAGLITQQLPQFAQAVGTNLLDQAANVLGFGTVGREFLREVSPAGDAFRVLTALQSLVGGLTNVQLGTQQSKSGGGGI